MTSFTELKIAVGLRQVSSDISGMAAKLGSETHRHLLNGFVDRINGYAAELEAEKVGHRETSDEISSLASKVLREQPREGDEHLSYNALLKTAKRLAGSCLAQDETPGLRGEPNAGTSAYQMLADAETANVEVTETLIHMVAATVLMKLADKYGATENPSVEFTPKDMDDMLLYYDMDAKRDGMLTVVRIIAKSDAENEPPVSLYVQAGDTDAEPVKPQVEAHDYDRPLWAIKYYDRRDALHFAKMHDKTDAERHLIDYTGRFDQPEPTIENRFCLHSGCPAEHCNLEVTSGD